MSSKIEGHSGEENIVIFWRNHFKEVLTDVNRKITESKNLKDFNHNMIVYKEDIAKAVSQLQKNKSARPYRLSAENFINSSTNIYEHIGRLFTAMFRYS